MTHTLIKIILILISVGLILWNYLWRATINLPFLSDLSSTTIWIIAIVILTVEEIWHLTSKRKN